MQLRYWMTALAVTALLAAGPVSATEASTEECAANEAPPCGWIAPLLDLVFDDKPVCGNGYVLGGETDPADCMVPPQDGEPLVLEGEFRLFWELCEEATYLNDPADPIEVSFSGTNRNPTFLSYSIEPSSFTLDTTTLFDPQYIRTAERHDGSPTCWYDYRAPVTVTFERNGDPSSSDVEQILNQKCVAQYYVKMQSDESGERFKSGWGIEPFRFHMLNDPLGESICDGIDTSGRATPTVGAPVLVAGLAALAVAIRRV